MVKTLAMTLLDTREAAAADAKGIVWERTPEMKAGIFTHFAGPFLCPHHCGLTTLVRDVVLMWKTSSGILLPSLKPV